MSIKSQEKNMKTIQPNIAEYIKGGGAPCSMTEKTAGGITRS